MSQRDCGCPGLVTPTLDELLAVARKKPLPRIRERRPPPARVSATLKGWMEWRLVNRQGREVAGGEGPNLILDQGLDQIATTAIINPDTNIPSFFPLIAYCAVGTDSSTPDPSDTGLGSEVARTSASFQAETNARPSDGVHTITRFIEFDYDQANGNLTEWGFSSSSAQGSNLFNRALFTDSGGNPDTVTKTDQEKLRLTYTLEVSLSPVSLTPGSFTVTNVGTVSGNYVLLGAAAASVASDRCAAPDLHAFSALARGGRHTVVLSSDRPAPASITAWPDDLSGVTYDDNPFYPSDTTNRRTAREAIAADAYVAGSFTRTGGGWKFDTSDGNLDPIRAFLVGGIVFSDSVFGTCNRFGYAFDLELASEFTKDNEHTLTIGAPTVSWGRDSS